MFTSAFETLSSSVMPHFESEMELPQDKDTNIKSVFSKPKNQEIISVEDNMASITQIATVKLDGERNYIHLAICVWVS